MTLRNTLLSGLAGLAIAGAVSFGAQGQTVPATAPQADNPGQMPATAPSAGIPGGPKVHHRRYQGQSGPQDSTPAEAAATDRLNDQQVVADAAPQATPIATPAVPATPIDPVTPN